MDTTTPAVQKRIPRTILIAGGKTNAQSSLTILLQRFKYNISIANTAAEALESAVALHPDLIISDLAIPGTSGIDLIQQLRNDKRTASIPVIFTVSASDASAERRCMDYGATGCISKPIQAEEVYRTVQAVVERRPRENIRIDLRMPVSVDTALLAGSAEVCEVGLSEYGMYLPTGSPGLKNKRIKVEMHSNDRTLSVEGTVLYANAAGAKPGQAAGMGIKFTAITPQDQAFIRKLIHDEVTQEVLAALARDEDEQSSGFLSAD